MKLIVTDPHEKKRILAQRRAWGADRFDEVWDGVYVMSPLANDEHQEISGLLFGVILTVIGWPRLGDVRPGVNVSDRIEGWKHNYRCPDIAVFLKGCKAKNCGAFWFGGPDFAAEIVSKRDRSRKKLEFYAKIGTRELLIVDRYPWALELYVLKRGKLKLAGCSTLEDPQTIESTVLPLTFRLVDGETRPVIEVTHIDGKEVWRV
jgi:Uma2 family endonuclease